MVKLRDLLSPKGTFLVNSASPTSLALRGAGPTPSHTMEIGSGEHRFLVALGPGPATSSFAPPRLPGSPAAAALSISVTQKTASLMSARMVRTPQVVGILIML
jgi:hypothetical protein